MGGFAELPGETPIDPSGLKDRNLCTRSQLNVAEFDNIALALDKYFGRKLTRRSAPFTYAWVVRLHKEMFGRVWAWAGKTRTTDLNIGVPWPQVEPMLYGLLEDLRLWEESGLDLTEQAVMLHHRAVSIHPFLNGNGRWSRLLTNIWLKLHGSPPVPWDENSLARVSPFRGEYLAAVKAADAGDYEPLKTLHMRHTPAGE